MQHLARIDQFVAQHIVHDEIFFALAVVGFARENQQRFDQCFHLARGAADALHGTLTEFAQSRFVRQHVGRHLDHGERAA